MKPYRIVHVVYRFDTGGMENGMVNLFNHMSAAHFQHFVIALTNVSDFRLRIINQAVEFHALHRQPGHDYGWMLKMWRLLRKLKPNLVHTRNLSSLEAQFVAAAAGVRETVHGEHGRDMFDLHGKNWKYNLLRRTARPFVSRYVAVSKDLANWLRETVHVPERKISQIYNGVDSVKFQPRHGLDRTGLPKGFAGPDSLVIGSVGRMAEVKNFPSLVRAFMCLASVSSDMADRVRLVIVGDGVARQACLDLLDQSGLSKLAWLPGERSDVAEIMRSLDVFVLPSLNEGISNTILEAQASGLPVIATRVGGNVELVEENVNGLLVEPNDEEGLARALQGYFENPALSKRHGAIARSRVEHAFSIPAMVQSYETVYRQVLEGVK